MAWKRALNALEARLGQEGAAEALGVTSRTLRRYKQGKRKPSQDKQNSIENAWSYLRGSKPLKSIKPKNRAKVRKQRVNKVDERLDIGYKERGTKKYQKAMTKHKQIDVSDLSAQDICDTIHLLYNKEGYTSFGFMVHVGIIEEDEEPFEEAPEGEHMGVEDFWITFETLRIEDYLSGCSEMIRSWLKNLKKTIKARYKLKKVEILEIILYAIKELPHKKAV
jgi:transcriptional regulator with XRE-family HTH domain